MFCTRRKQLAKLHGHKTAGRRSDHLLSFFGGLLLHAITIIHDFLGGGWLNHQLTLSSLFQMYPLACA